MSERKKDSFCSWCGCRFPPDIGWPKKGRVCAACDNITYRNPLTVAVLIQPVTSGGVIAVRRGIEPKIGELALPGGYVDYGETWEAAAAREMREETGIIVSPGSIRLFRVRTSSTGAVISIFGIGEPIDEDRLPLFVPNEEVLERLILRAPVDLPFLSHKEALRDWFAEHHK